VDERRHAHGLAVAEIALANPIADLIHVAASLVTDRLSELQRLRLVDVAVGVQGDRHLLCHLGLLSARPGALPLPQPSAPIIASWRYNCQGGRAGNPGNCNEHRLKPCQADRPPPGPSQYPPIDDRPSTPYTTRPAPPAPRRRLRSRAASRTPGASRAGSG